jgi:hypothetical protein
MEYDTKPARALATGKPAAVAVIFATLCLMASVWSHARPVVYVSDVAELYAAVNDATNAGAVVILAPGLYALAANNVNAGRLELQRDMELHGSPGYSDDVVIDAAALPIASYSFPPFATGAVRMGRGSNAIEWLTVQGAVNGASAIGTDLVSPGPTRIRVAHVVARGNVRGLDVRNIGPASAGRVLDVEITDNVFVNHVTGAGQGLRLLNLDAAAAVIRATLRGNRSYGNIAGCIAANISTSYARIEIRSTADRFDGNGNGCVLLAGQGTLAAPAEGNLLQMAAQASTFQDNVGALPAAYPIPGGILAIAGQSLGIANRAFRNTLLLELWGVQMEGNHGVDINAWGAWTTAAQPAGTDNAVAIVLRGIATKATASATPSEPIAPGSGNIVTILR